MTASASFTGLKFPSRVGGASEAKALEGVSMDLCDAVQPARRAWLCVHAHASHMCDGPHTCMYLRAHHDTAQHLHHAMRVGRDGGDAGELMPSRLDVCWTNSVKERRVRMPSDFD